MSEGEMESVESGIVTQDAMNGALSTIACFGLAFRKLENPDRRHMRLFLTHAIVAVFHGEYESGDDFMQDAIRRLQPKAVDWNALLAFIQALVPIIEQMIAQCQ